MYLIDALKVFDRTQGKKKGAFRSPLAWGVLSLTEQLPSQPSLLKCFSSLGACSPIGNFIPLYHRRALALSIKGRINQKKRPVTLHVLRNHNRSKNNMNEKPHPSGVKAISFFTLSICCPPICPPRK